jgi:cytidylate kinase
LKVTEISLTREAVEERDYRDIFAIEIDDVKVFRVSDGEPEDSNLSRDFSDVYSIPELMQKAYDAGKRGEEITFEQNEVDEY